MSKNEEEELACVSPGLRELLAILSNSSLFQKWLREFEPEEIVGLAGSCASCPIAKFVREQGLKLQVFPEELVILEPDANVPLGHSCLVSVISIQDTPSLRWVAKFVKAVDVTTSSDTISSATALKVLKSLTV